MTIFINGDATEAAKYRSTVEHYLNEMTRTFGNVSRNQSYWRQLSDTAKVHLRLINGSPFAYLYVEGLGEIIVWPVSDSFPNGWGDLPRVAMSYDPTKNNALTLKKKVKDDVIGGNCYWRDDNGENLLTWEGPWGFQIAPAPIKFEAPYTYYSATAGGYAPTYTYFSKEGVHLTTYQTDCFIITTYARFSGVVYQGGKALTTSTSLILGCGILAGNLVVVVNTSAFKDTILTKPLSALDSDWITVGDIDYENTEELTYLPRQGVYTFSQNGGSIIAVVDTYNAVPTTVSVLHIPITGPPTITYEQEITQFLNTSVVRISLAMSEEGGITLGTITFTPSNIPKALKTINQSASSDFNENYHLNISASTVLSITGTSVIAAGFVGNVESLMVVSLDSYSGSSSRNLDFTGDAVGSGGQNTKYKVSCKLSDVDILTGDLICDVDNVYSYSSVGHAPGPYFMLTSATDDTSATDYYVTLYFVDIANSTCVINHIKHTNDRSTSTSGFSQATALITKNRSKNGTVTQPTVTKSINLSGNYAPMSSYQALDWVYVFLDGAGSAQYPGYNNWREAVAYLAPPDWDGETPLEPTSKGSSSTSTVELPIYNLRGSIVKPIDFIYEPDWTQCYVDTMPVCKGVVDKSGNFVGQFMFRYIDKFEAAGGSHPDSPYAVKEAQIMSLPDGADAGVIFEMTGSNQSLSGGLANSSVAKQKIFLLK